MTGDNHCQETIPNTGSAMTGSTPATPFIVADLAARQPDMTIPEDHREASAAAPSPLGNGCTLPPSTTR